MSIDLRKSVTDAGYIAIGAGVLGFQQAQTRRRDIQASWSERSADLRTRAGDAGHYVVAHLASPRTVVASVTDQAKDAVSPAIDAVRTRIEPAVEQLRGVPAQVTASIPSIPESVKGVPAQVAAVIPSIPESVKAAPPSCVAPSEPVAAAVIPEHSPGEAPPCLGVVFNKSCFPSCWGLGSGLACALS